MTNTAETLELHEETDCFEKEEAQIIEKIGSCFRNSQINITVLGNVPKRKLLEEAAKVYKALSIFKTHIIANTGAFVVTNRLGSTIY